MEIKLTAISDVGKERSNNEDAFAICSDLENPRWDEDKTREYIKLGSLGSVLIVADGMGGANSGEIASRIAIDSIKNSFTYFIDKEFLSEEKYIHKLLEKSIKNANENINEYVKNNPDSNGAGTTIVILWILRDKAYIAWCGDSRCYCFNHKFGLKLLTKDHSYVQELIDKGEISKEEALIHPDSNVITRCIGDVDANTTPDIISYTISSEDMFLLCTDGLCGYCIDEDIEKICYKFYKDIEKCKLELLNIALKSGGLDNITIALCSYIFKKNDTVTKRTSFRKKIHEFINKIF